MDKARAKARIVVMAVADVVVVANVAKAVATTIEIVAAAVVIVGAVAVAAVATLAAAATVAVAALADHANVKLRVKALDFFSREVKTCCEKKFKAELRIFQSKAVPLPDFFKKLAGFGYLTEILLNT